MKTKPLARLALSTAIAATLMSGAAYAQQTDQSTPPPPPSAQNAPTTAPVRSSPGAQQAANAKNASTLQQVVVTGTATFGGVKKIDASYSITSMSADQIKQANPKSAADLLKASPGIYPESSGGQTGANIEVAGFPGGGDAPYVTFQLNGSPLYPMSSLSFMENSSMFRLDDTIDRAELVQGGPGVLYGNGQPGLTGNFILREGTDTPSGDLGYTYGSEGMSRIDGFIGFPLGKDTGWYGSFGGFWRKSDGVRNPQFPADNGGQLSATISRDWDSGSLMFYARALKDHNQFVTDTPILNPNQGTFSNYPGFNPLTGTFGSKADQYETIQVTPCNTAGCTPGGIPLNLAKGRGADIHMFGSNFDWDFGNGLSISDKLNFTGGQMNTVSFFSTGANPSTLGEYISSQVASDIASGELPAGTYTSSATYANNGAAANMNQNVTTQGYWYVHKRIAAISNEFHISKELFDGNTLTLGNYTAVYNDHDTWYLGNNMLLQAISNPDPIAVDISNGTNTYQLSSPAGFTSGPSTAIYERWNGFNTAFFLTDTWKLDNWLFDAGIREERQQASGGIQNTATGDLDDNPFTLYNNGSQYLASGMSYINYRKSAPSWTLGANYEFTPNMSAYVRLNDGVHFPGFDDLRGLPSTPVEKIHNQEIGFKYQADWVYLDVNAYHRIFFGVPYTYTNPFGQQVSLVYGTSTKGVNLNTTFKPFEHVTLTLSGDYMDGHYTNTGLQEYTTQSGAAAFASMYGMVLQRQPKVQFRFTPAYDLPTSWGSLRAAITYEYVGSRYGDLIEQQPLGNFYDLSFNVSANVGQHWVYTVMGTNMTNQIGITEGNARLFGFASSGGVILARSIEGREVQGQIKYKF
ncbi:TonB-dependent receptor [Dyella acidiphila]|uniref:TonB-dependent receptor n=1 Tax=Dyella acidiphila TaxID=2775866 RepID=A0ABR9GBM1_9GAMM|nr:TonB-dependent receptor [Dyella acidiphila]MBE1161456.1 TonB-dependent receptor [Dyella acidiphila]